MRGRSRGCPVIAERSGSAAAASRPLGKLLNSSCARSLVQVLFSVYRGAITPRAEGRTMTEQTATTPDFSGSSGTPGPTGRRGPAALRHRGFRQLASAWVFTNAADSALYLMLAVWVKELTGSDGAACAVLATLGLPALIAPFLGQLADRVSRKWLLAVGNLAMALVVLSLVLVGGAEDVWAIYAVTFLYGAMGFLTASAQSGLVRDLLSDDELAGGNGLLTTVDQAFRLVSPLVGTALYVAAGPRAVVVLTAACFTVSAILLTRVEVVETGRPEASGSGYWAELVGGVRHLVATAPLGVLTVTKRSDEHTSELQSRGQ